MIELFKTLALTFFWIALATAAWAGLSAAPWVPSRRNDRQLLVDSLPVREGDVVYDLGCGTGTLLVDLAKRYSNAELIGVEISILPYLIAKVRSWKHKNMHIQYGNLFNINVQKADIVLIYLLAKAYPKLLKKLRSELRPQAMVALEAWPFEGIKPWKTFQRKHVLPIHVYRGEDLKG